MIDGETGFVVNPYDIEALADRLIRLLADEPLRRQMAEAGRRRIMDQFTLRQQTEEMLAVYADALHKRKREKSSDL